MEENQKGKIIPRPSRWRFFTSLLNEIRLVWRLLWDRRVSIFLKLLPIGSLVYLIFPDLFPTPIDDAGLLGIGVYLFIELSPQDVVEEHRAALRGEKPEESEVVEGEFKDEGA